MGSVSLAQHENKRTEIQPLEHGSVSVATTPMSTWQNVACVMVQRPRAPADCVPNEIGPLIGARPEHKSHMPPSIVHQSSLEKEIKAQGDSGLCSQRNRTTSRGATCAQIAHAISIVHQSPIRPKKIQPSRLALSLQLTARASRRQQTIASRVALLTTEIHMRAERPTSDHHMLLRGM